MNDNRSVATIDAPEFIDITPFNPLISQCQIKVLYIGKNRNGSYIDKNTAIQMANSLPGTPIVGAYREDIEDFGDHGHVIKIEDGEVKFAVKTKPYGFVSPDTRVWFKKFKDVDDFGNEVEREYLMATGYLWTGQYKEAMSVIQEGKGQSMELDEESLDGKWARDNKDGMEFFIINDALFSKLCILGDDVEPCFEGASITATDGEYSTDVDFAYSLYTMINQLKDALAVEGGLNMPKNLKEFEESGSDSSAESGSTDSGSTGNGSTSNGSTSEGSTDNGTTEGGSGSNGTDKGDGGDKGETKPTTPTDKPTEPSKPSDTENSKPDTKEDDSVSSQNKKRVVAQNSLTEDSPEFAEKKKEEQPAEEKAPAAKEEPAAKEKPAGGNGGDAKPADAPADEKAPAKEAPSEEEPADKKKKAPVKSSLANDDAIMAELKELRAFKLKIENERKDAVINKYHMLSDEDKADVVAHKNEYTEQQIDEKLALVYVKKNVDFDAVDGKREVEVHEEPSPLMSFSLDDSNGNTGDAVDAVQEALREVYNI